MLTSKRTGALAPVHLQPEGPLTRAPLALVTMYAGTDNVQRGSEQGVRDAAAEAEVAEGGDENQSGKAAAVMDDEFQMLAAQMAARGGLSATELQEWIASVAQVQGNAELLEKAEQTVWVLFEQLGYTTRQTVRRCTITEQ